MAGRVVFLDINHDGKLDPGDPHRTTDAQGNFTLIGASSGIPVVVEATDMDANARYVVDQTHTVNGIVTIGVVPISSVAPVPVVPNPFSTHPSVNPRHGIRTVSLPRGAGTNREHQRGHRLDGSHGIGGESAGHRHGLVNSIEHRQDEVFAYYEQFLHRTPGLESAVWVNELLSGVSEEDVVAGILDAPEYQSANKDPSLFIPRPLHRRARSARAIQQVLPAGKRPWHQERAEIRSWPGFVNSIEAKDQMVQSFYTAYLHRPRELGPASNGWVTMLEAPNGSATDMAIGFLCSTEFIHESVTPQT